MQTCNLAAMHHAKLYSLSTTLSRSEGFFLCCLFQLGAHCYMSADLSELERLSRRRCLDPAGLVGSCDQQSGTPAFQPALLHLLIASIAPRCKAQVSSPITHRKEAYVTPASMGMHHTTHLPSSDIRSQSDTLRTSQRVQRKCIVPLNTQNTCLLLLYGSLE